MVPRKTRYSTISSKGQITIPLEIRKVFNLKAGDRVVYRISGGKIEITPQRGSIIDAAGTVKPKTKPLDLKKVRESTKKTVGKRAAEK